jgi:putative inorganic carbon (HCO3(-)) transporter
MNKTPFRRWLRHSRAVNFLHNRRMVIATTGRPFWNSRCFSTQWHRKVFEGLLLIYLFLTPLYRFQDWVLYGLIGVIGFYRIREKRVVVNLELGFLGIFLFLAALCSENFRLGLEALGEFESHLGLAFLAGTFFSPEFSRKVLRFLVLTGFVWLAIGFGQQLSGTPTPPGWLDTDQAAIIAVRIYSVFSNPNIYALYLLNLIGVSRILSCAEAERKVYRIIFTLIFLGGLFSLYFTYSRGGWLLASIFLAYWYWGRIKPEWRLGILLVAGIMLFFCFAGFRARFFSIIKMTDSSLLYRLRILTGVFRALRDYWIWGAGPGSFPAIYPLYQPSTTSSMHAHSFYLQLWLEYGLLALLAFGGYFGRFFFKLRAKSADPSLKAAMTGIIFFLGAGFWESWQVSHFCSGYFWLLTGLALSLQDKELAYG